MPAGLGVPTANAVAEAVLGAPGTPVFAEVADALDGAKCLALGATAVSFAGEAVETLLEDLQLAVWAVGERSPGDLTPGHLRGPLM